MSCPPVMRPQPFIWRKPGPVSTDPYCGGPGLLLLVERWNRANGHARIARGGQPSCPVCKRTACPSGYLAGGPFCKPPSSKKKGSKRGEEGEMGEREAVFSTDPVKEVGVYISPPLCPDFDGVLHKIGVLSSSVALDP